MAMKSAVMEEVHAIEMLKEDHRRIKELFHEFDGASEKARQSIAREAIEELELHSYVEEQVFYPAVREVNEELVIESEEAHHMLDVLISELKMMPAGEHFDAKFSLMIKNVKDHMKEEEGTLFPEVERAKIDLYELGQEMEACRAGYLPSIYPASSGVAKAAAFFALGVGIYQLGKRFLR